MLSALATAALVSAFAGASASEAADRRAPDLAIRARRERRAPSLDAAGTARAGTPATPPCLGDVCQPRVSIPGMAPRYVRPSRTELAAVYLDRIGLEPFATVAWLFLATGLRLDYEPPVFEGPARAPTGFGTFFVRMKLRVDADNLPVIPRRGRAR